MYPRLYVPEEWSGCCILGREKNYICNALGDIAGKVHSFPEVRLCSILLGAIHAFAHLVSGSQATVAASTGPSVARHTASSCGRLSQILAKLSPAEACADLKAR